VPTTSSMRGASSTVWGLSSSLPASTCAGAIARLHQLDQRVASNADAAPETALALRARGRILVISEALAEHTSYFDAGTIA
jgi:hypothetical protein